MCMWEKGPRERERQTVGVGVREKWKMWKKRWWKVKSHRTERGDFDMATSHLCDLSSQEDCRRSKKHGDTQ